MRISPISMQIYLIVLKSWPYCNWWVFLTLKCCLKMAKCELVVGRPWNAARRWWNANLWLQEPWSQEFHVPDTHAVLWAPITLHYPRPLRVPSFIKSRTLRILPTHFLLFWNSLYVYTQGILGCLLRFWPLGQNPAGAIKI